MYIAHCESIAEVSVAAVIGGITANLADKVPGIRVHVAGAILDRTPEDLNTLHQNSFDLHVHIEWPSIEVVITVLTPWSNNQADAAILLSIA